MPKPGQDKNGRLELFAAVPIGLTPSDESLILALQARLSEADQPEVSQRQVVRLAVRFAGQSAKNKRFSLIRQETATAVEERRQSRGTNPYKIRSFPIFSKDLPAFKILSKELKGAGLSHTRSDVLRGSLRALLELSAHPVRWRAVRSLNAQLTRECAEHDQRRRAASD